MVTAKRGNATLGSTAEGTVTDFITDGSGTYINACRFTGTYQCALYSDNFGALQTLLASTNRLTPTTDDW